MKECNLENFFYTNRNHPDLDTLVTFVTNNYNLFIDSKIIDNNGGYLKLIEYIYNHEYDLKQLITWQ